MQTLHRYLRARPRSGFAAPCCLQQAWQAMGACALCLPAGLALWAQRSCGQAGHVGLVYVCVNQADTCIALPAAGHCCGCCTSSCITALCKHFVRHVLDLAPRSCCHTGNMSGRWLIAGSVNDCGARIRAERCKDLRAPCCDRAADPFDMCMRPRGPACQLAFKLKYNCGK